MMSYFSSLREAASSAASNGLAGGPSDVRFNQLLLLLLLVVVVVVVVVAVLVTVMSVTV